MATLLRGQHAYMKGRWEAGKYSECCYKSSPPSALALESGADCETPPASAQFGETAAAQVSSHSTPPVGSESSGVSASSTAGPLATLAQNQDSSAVLPSARPSATPATLQQKTRKAVNDVIDVLTQ